MGKCLEYLDSTRRVYPELPTSRHSMSGWKLTLLSIILLKLFIPNAVPGKMILLLDDGHSTHLGNKLIETAVGNDKIILIPNLLQPMFINKF